MENIPYIVHESGMARMERTVKRLWILCILLILLLVGTNVAWIIYETQYIEEVEIQQEVDTGKGDAFISGIGDIYYGESETEDN